MADPMSLEEHRLLGRALYNMNDQLVHSAVSLSNRYGKSKRLSGRFSALLKALGEVRSELDEQLARDHPDEFDSHVYYPGRHA